MTHSVLLVEDDDNTRNRLKKAINNHPDLNVSFSFSNLTDARKGIKTADTLSVALIDIGLPDGSGLELINELTLQKEPVPSMVISVLGDEQHVMAALRAGATGYILKDSRMEDIAQDIITLIDGGSPISPKIARHLLKHFNAPIKQAEEKEDVCELTTRESEVLLLISHGYKRKEIADSLKLSINSIGTHVNSIYRKLSVTSNIEAIKEALVQGLL